MIELTLSQRSGVAFYRQMYDQIAEAIRAGRLPPGTQLPSVRDLATTLLVSAITVRRAYADLEIAGLIAREQGRGTFVREIATATESDAQDQARDRLTEAVREALAVGLPADDVRTWVERHLAQPPASEESP